MPRPALWPYAAGICLGLAGICAMPDVAAWRDIAAIVAANPHLRVAAWRVRPLAGEIVAEGITDDGLRIGRLRLPLASPLHGLATLVAPSPAHADSPAPAAATGTISAEDISFTSGAATYRLKSIELAGTDLTKDGLAALVDSKTSDTLESRFARISARAVVIPEIAIDDATPGSERHALIRKVALAIVVAGKASAATVANVSLAVTAGQDAANLSTGPIEAADIDLAQLAHVALTRRTAASEAQKPLFGKLVVERLKLENAARNTGFDIGSISAASVAGRALATASADAVVTPGSNAASALLLADLVQSFAIATLDVDDFTLHGAASDGGTNLTVKQAGLQGLGAGKVGGLHLRGLDLSGPTAKLGIGSADLGAITIPDKTTDARLAARPGKLDLGDITMEVAAKDATTPLKLTIGHVALAQEGGPSAIPSTGSASVDNLGLDLAPDGTLTRALNEMGYRRATLSAAFTSSYDAGAQELAIHKFALNEPAMGSLELTLRLANVSPDLLSTDPEAAQAAAITVLAKTLDLRIANAGLFDKALALKAQQDGISIADERAFGIDFFRNKLPVLLGEGQGIKTIGDAVAKFIADPKTLHIALVSKDGIGLGAAAMLGDPGALLDTLDIKASAND